MSNFMMKHLVINNYWGNIENKINIKHGIYYRYEILTKFLTNYD